MIALAIPNLITLFRILLVIPLTWLMAERQFVTVLGLFAVAGLSDALDGYLARHFGWMTRLGALLDPLADKVLLISAYGMLGWLGLVPLWLVALVVLRDLAIVTGAVAFRLLVGPVEMAPTMVSKVNTAVQILYVLLILISAGVQPIPPLFSGTMAAAVAATTILSGSHYVWAWTRRAVAERTEAER